MTSTVDLNAELKQKISEKKGVADDEKYRLALGCRTPFLVCLR